MKLKIKNKKEKNKLLLRNFSLILLFLLALITSFESFSDDLIYSSLICDKHKGACFVSEDRILKKDLNFSFKISDILFVKKNASCGKYSCTYDVWINTKNGYIEIYRHYSNKAYIENIVSTFDDFITLSDFTYFEIKRPTKRDFPVFSLFLFVLASVLLLFAIFTFIMILVFNDYQEE